MSTSGTSEKKVRLMFYERQNEEIVIDGINGKEWDDFIIVYLAGDLVRTTWWDRENETLAQSLKDYANRTGKEIIVVPEGSDIAFYGVEVETNE